MALTVMLAVTVTLWSLTWAGYIPIGRVNTVRILIPGTKLNSQEKPKWQKYLVKAGYAVSVSPGKEPEW